MSGGLRVLDVVPTLSSTSGLEIFQDAGQAPDTGFWCALIHVLPVGRPFPGREISSS